MKGSFFEHDASFIFPNYYPQGKILGNGRKYRCEVDCQRSDASRNPSRSEMRAATCLTGMASSAKRAGTKRTVGPPTLIAATTRR
jgi:hypothetical protein